MIVEMTEEKLSRLANDACRRGEYDKALKFYRRLYHDFPTSWVYGNLVGYCLVFLGKYEEGRTFFHQALELGGLEETVMNNLAWSYNEEGHEDKAFEILEPLVEKYPEDWSMQFNMGNSLYSLDMYEKALFYFERVVKLNPDIPTIHYSLGVTNYHLNEFAKARDYFLHFLQLRDSDDALYFLSKCYLELEQYEEHIEVADLLLDINEHDEEVLRDMEFSSSKLFPDEE